MSADTTSTNPIVQAIIAGTAPAAACMAAARGMLPLPQEDLLEVLVALRAGGNEQLSREAAATLDAQEPESFLALATAADASPAVLGYLAEHAPAKNRELHEAVVLNARTPDKSIAALAGATADASLIELIAINQQRLIRAPDIIYAVLNNPARTPEAERRVRETQREFFEKERGAQQVADELRARGQQAAAEFIEAAESISGDQSTLTIEDAWLIAEHIEVSDADIDDSWLPSERFEELFEESDEQRIANAERIINETRAEGGGEVAPERISLIRRIMLMKVKDRIKLGMKGDREARAILIRDANKVVAQAVIHNPRLSDQEVEAIAAMRAVSDEVLRLIALNRAWTRSYLVIHNLVRNPRTPIAAAIGLLNRIQSKDLKTLSQNRNVSDAVRRQANRIALSRTGH